jgi:hypothetical protein
LALFQTNEVNNEIVRMANLASTRMSTVQQTMNEEHETVNRLHNFLNQAPKITAQLDDMNGKLNWCQVLNALFPDQLGELHRHLLQIEIALAALDSSAAKLDNQVPKTKIIDVT